MKAVVEHYAKGDFKVDRPEVVISETFLKLNIESSTTYEGSFTVSSRNDHVIRAMVYDSRFVFKFESHSFIAKKFEVKYSFEARCLEAGRTFNGHISVITDGGEIKIPYEIEITPPVVKNGNRKIDDLFKFAALAENDWNTAVTAFKRDDFQRTFIDKDPVLKQIYSSLIVDSEAPADQALEEFLVYIHKKRALTLTVSKTRISIEMPKETSQVSVDISKNTWGYTNSVVKSKDDFLIPSKTAIVSNDFTGNMFTLDILVNPELVPEGVNYGTIEIVNIYQTIRIEIVLVAPNTKTGLPVRDLNTTQKIKKSQIRLFNAYMDYRMDKLDFQQYIENTLFAYDSLSTLCAEEDLYRLGVMHMNIMDGETERVMQEITRIEADVDHSNMNPTQKAYYLYLKALIEKDAKSISHAKNFIALNYAKDSKNRMFFFWLLLFLDDELSNDSAKLYKEIAALYDQGYNSPIMYMELCEILNNNPLVLKNIKELEITTIRWGLRHRFISDEVVEVFIRLAREFKNFDSKIFAMLEAIYDRTKDEEVLKSICSMLIGAKKLDNKYHRFYRDAVEKSLNFVGLNECFVKSMNFSRYDLIPTSVLMYLNYKNTLSEAEQAYLYANVIYNKASNKSVYHEYSTTMQDFMENMIIKGTVSDDLTVIYDEFLDPETVNPIYADKLINIIFRRKLVCDNKGVRAVVVTHQELEDVQVVPLVNGEAYIEILSPDASIVFEDNLGNRYAGSIPYKLERIVDEKAYLDICCKHSPNDYRVILHNYKKLGEFTYKRAIEVNTARSIVNCDEISYKYKQKAYLNIIEYYHQNLDADVLKKYLRKLDIDYLDHSNARTLIGYMIDMQLYDKAFQAVNLYGFDEIDTDELFELAKYGVDDTDSFSVYNEDLLAICVHLYKIGKYNERVLEYTMHHYIGDLESLATLFKIARARVRNMTELSLLAENTLAQMMFAKGKVEYIYEIFDSYYEGRNRSIVVKAFLRYTAYNYIIWDAQVPSSIFECLFNEILKGNISDEISKMALLSYFSRNDRYTEKEKDWIYENVNRFLDAGKLLPFYKNFKSFVNLPQDVFLKTYLVYKADAGKQIEVKYGFDTGSRQTLSYKTGRMEEMIPGLYVREFVVFHGERLVYEIDDDIGKSATVYESEILKNKNFSKKNQSRFEIINSMLVNQEMRKDDELLEALDIYVNRVHLFEESLNLL